MPKTTIFKYCSLLILVGGLMYRGVVPCWNNVHSDFANYFVSARLLVKHDVDSLYHDAWFKKKAIEMNAAVAVKFSPFPPITCFIMAPLAIFELPTANRIWLIINILLFIPGIYIVSKLSGWNRIDAALLILISGWAIFNNFRFGQVYWLMTVCLLYAIHGLHQQNRFTPSIIIGFFAMLKYFPVCLVFGQFVDRKYKVVFYSTLVIAMLLLIQWLYFGSGVMQHYIYSTLFPHFNGHISSQDPSALEFQSIESFLLNVCGTNNFLKSTIKVFVYLILVVPMIYLFWIFRKSDDKNQSAIVYISVPCLAALVLLPASATYHFILLLIPMAILVHSEIAAYWKRIFLLFHVVIGFIPYGLFFELGRKFAIVLAYPRLMLITILYITVVYVVWITFQKTASK